MKRKRKYGRDQRADKRQKTENHTNGQATWPLLRQYYPKVLTLRQYLIWALSKSKKRQRRLLHYGTDSERISVVESDPDVIQLLDTIVIGTSSQAEVVDDETIDKEITLFTQQLAECSATITPTQGAMKQFEIVDFTLWEIFRRHHGYHRPPHLLAHGFQKHATGAHNGTELVSVPGVPGVWSIDTNQYMKSLKEHPWSALPSLLGRSAETILSEMLLHCGVFRPVDNSSNLSQLSGVPMSDLKPMKSVQSVLCQPGPLAPHSDERRKSNRVPETERGLSDIRFVRSRMLYARPTLNAKGTVQFGLGRAHVLNRFSDVEDDLQTIRILKYIFPRQFGLHNAFTSKVDKINDTAQPFKDYTLREEEIDRADYEWRQSKVTDRTTQRPLPKRLRGEAWGLVRRLRKRHFRCSYKAILEHYCPKPLQRGSEGSIDQASSLAQVSAFCRAVVQKVFPLSIWGNGEVQSHNRKLILQTVDSFVRLRRFENLSLHDVLQKLRVTEISWLAPQNVNKASKLSKTDFIKRKELMAELLYYLFDSFLIPLIRGHFYVTEGSVNRNQLCFFRQDVWKSISDPALKSLKNNMLEPCSGKMVEKQLAKRELGVSLVRMLPKEQGMRPIINLRRRIQKLEHGRVKLGRSTNSILTPAFSVLNHEKTAQADMLGSALFSAEDMYPRLQAFRTTLERQGFGDNPLYFAKVDVKACFDTIPQKRLMELARRILNANAYHIAKYNRAKLVGGHNDDKPGFGAKPSWKYLTRATANENSFDFLSEIERDTTEGRTRTVYVDGVVQSLEYRGAILKLLETHIESNLIKIGNRFYRQKEGIPQGSIVSSLLCSYFYAELEREVLGFVQDGESILLRLIDDFLVISTSKEVAERFIRTMHRGLPDFGVQVKAEKSRVNFDIDVGGSVITRLPHQTEFPYCGSAINTVTLNLSKDKERRKQSNISDSTSVEYSKFPGQAFYRKTLDNLKLQMQAMLLSTKYNHMSTVLSNLHHSFTEVALKTYHYIRSLPANKQPGSKLVIKAVDDLIKLACVLMKKRKRTSKDVLPYECCVKDAQARWLACTAFIAVFRRRQTKHNTMLRWLERQLALPTLKAQQKTLMQVVGGNS